MTTTRDKIIDSLHSAVDDAVDELLNDINIFDGAFLAERFCALGAKQQAEFFSEVARLASGWVSGAQGTQWARMNGHLESKGRALIARFQEYANPSDTEQP